MRLCKLPEQTLPASTSGLHLAPGLRWQHQGPADLCLLPPGSAEASAAPSLYLSPPEFLEEISSPTAFHPTGP